MEGITYITNETENKRYVQIDLDLYQEEWEDFYDSLIVKMRKKNNSKKISFEEMLAHLDFVKHTEMAV